MFVLGRSRETGGLRQVQLAPEQGDLVQQRLADGFTFLVAAGTVAIHVGTFPGVPLAIPLLPLLGRLAPIGLPPFAIIALPPLSIVRAEGSVPRHDRRSGALEPPKKAVALCSSPACAVPNLFACTNLPQRLQTKTRSKCLCL